MSVPPQLIRVKRKATDEDPVSFLRVQENKRHRSEAFVYRRQEEQHKLSENIPAEPPKPVIHISQPSTKPTAFQSSETPKRSTHELPSDNGANHEPVGVSPTETSSSGPVTSEPRQFRMSKRDMLLGVSQLARAHGGITKKRSTPALFVERRIKRISASPLQKVRTLANTAAPMATDMEIDKPEPRKLKKPGVSKLTNNKKENSQAYKADIPKSMTDRWNVDMDKLTAEMNAYAMEQIGLNLQKVNDEKVSEAPAKSQSKFKPKPIMRYAERHPETAQDQVDTDMMDTDVDISDSDDGDYIIETYERVPASKLGEHVPAHTVGLIVFDEDPELEFFFGDEGDSDVEWAEDEEDENAENYYAADYPEDEVASDDEYGHNPYSFRNGNASDLEEYDLDDDDDFNAAFSDKDDEGKLKSDVFKTYIGRVGRRGFSGSTTTDPLSRHYMNPNMDSTS
ncbi:hypothetical protein F4818DRAFT_170911 [Hypoxylon cercidicola]|nr:hypothetical protein F4818DRAFT_170911 [Hypoxylon cercidicola]